MLECHSNSAIVHKTIRCCWAWQNFGYSII